MKRTLRMFLPVAAVIFTLLTGCVGSPTAAPGASGPLAFNSGYFDIMTAVVDGNPVTYYAYKNISYVEKPVDTNYQILNVYIPEAVAESGNQLVQIFFTNDIGGYMSAKPIVPAATASLAKDADKANAAAVALSKGYVVVSPGARGSNAEVNGKFTGKAPAAIVDLKAAVRWLRFNDVAMPGSAEKIFADGTSAGGAMVTLLGASGNDPLYEPYLKALGAAEESDDIYGVFGFCPITDLENSDTAYEWLYNRVINDVGPDGKPLYGFSDEQKAMSAELKAMYPAYLNSLGLKSVKDGSALTDANYEDYIKGFLIASAQKALGKGTDMSAYPWVTVRDGKVVDLDFNKHLSAIGRMKMIKDPPAFDWLGDKSTKPPRGNGSRENLLYGTETKPTNVFTDYVAARLGTTVSKDVKERAYLMNAMNFVGKQGAWNAPYWYIRHGGADRDTSFTVPVALYTKLKNAGTTREIDFDLAWNRPHSGDYDLAEMFAWMDKVGK